MADTVPEAFIAAAVGAGMRGINTRSIQASRSLTAISSFVCLQRTFNCLAFQNTPFGRLDIV